MESSESCSRPWENHEVNKAEARQLLIDEVIQPLRGLSYQALVERFLSRPPEHFPLEGPSGSRYLAEIQGFWDEGKPGPFRVLASIDDGGMSAFKPLCEDFIKAEDSSIVGE